MHRIALKTITKTIVVGAFTFAAALIWREFIVDVLHLFFPEGEILGDFLAAVIATVILISFVYIFLKTEEEAEYVIKRIKKRRKKKKK
tara:strand:+ start:4118 stop:4381 length:264 start_codon:yes stop_codon:yes gene_type:complete